MSIVYRCRLDDQSAYFEDLEVGTQATLTVREFERLVSRRQWNKISTATRIAGAMYNYFTITDKLTTLGYDPKNLPLVICHRYANWDFVADMANRNIASTMDNVNGYVATAWFPATIQGHLTIDHKNVGEAITIATDDKELVHATVRSLMPTRAGIRGAVILGTFECTPTQIGGRLVKGKKPSSFGALSLIQASDVPEAVDFAISKHMEMY